MTKEQEKILIEKSIASCEGAYVPYSGFHVGACVLGEDGKFYTGFMWRTSPTAPPSAPSARRPSI